MKDEGCGRIASTLTLYAKTDNGNQLPPLGGFLGIPCGFKLLIHESSSRAILLCDDCAVKNGYLAARVASKERCVMAQNEKCEIGFGTAAVKLPGIVEKIIPGGSSAERERVQIRVKRGDDIYGVIRIENALLADDGKSLALKDGVEVDITITSNSDSMTRKG